ncbi:MAG: hypothetical protein FVQ81_14995 [Candidatus Glassbacteria bacterium]|nr:hypothetical protein [Candidatus Glassbacteria bacterium]
MKTAGILTVPLAPEGSRVWFALAGEPKEQLWYDIDHGLSGQLELYSEKLLRFFRGESQAEALREESHTCEALTAAKQRGKLLRR